MTPVSLPSPLLVPEGLEPILSIKEEEKEEAEDVDTPLANLINSFYPKEAYFPTLDASSPTPFTYPVPPLAEDGMYPESQAWLCCSCLVIKASQDVPYCIQYRENIPPLRNILPNISPVPAAWEPKKHHFKVQVAHICNPASCLYCSWVQKTGYDVDPDLHHVIQGHFFCIIDLHQPMVDVSLEVMEGSLTWRNYITQNCPLQYPPTSHDDTEALGHSINQPTFHV
jgi:hypothetical protein